MANKEIDEIILEGNTKLITLNTRVNKKAWDSIDQIKSILQSNYPLTTISKQTAVSYGLELAARMMLEEIEPAAEVAAAKSMTEEIKKVASNEQAPSKEEEKKKVPWSVKEYREKHHGG